MNILESKPVLKAKVNGNNNTVNQYVLADSSLLEYLRSHEYDLIKDLLDVYRESIHSLHLKEAANSLDKIRATLLKHGKLDNMLLASVDYLKAQCLKYADSQMGFKLYTQAYHEMQKAEQYNEDIVGDYAFVLLRQGKREECSKIAEDLLERYPDNILGNTCRLALANDVNEAYGKVPEQLKNDDRFLSYAYIYLPEDKRGILFDVDAYDYKVPDHLSYDNISLWCYYISLSITKLIRHEGYFFFGGSDHKTALVKEAYNISSKFLQLSDDTDIKDAIPDVKAIYTYTKFFIADTTAEERQKDIDDMKECKQSLDNHMEFTIMLFEMMLFMDDEHNAYELLNGNKEADIKLIDYLWVILSMRFDNSEYAKRGFSLIKEQNVKISKQYGLIILNGAIRFWEDINGLKANLKFEEATIQDVYETVYNYREKDIYDLDHIKDLSSRCPQDILYLLSEILADSGHFDEAIALIKPHVSTKKFSANPECYITYLQQKNEKAEIFKTLKSLRKNEFNKIHKYLHLELILATSCNDMQDTYEVIGVLYHKYPSNTNYLYNYASALVERGQIDEAKELRNQILNVGALQDTSLIQGFTNLLLALDYPEEALQFLYDQIRTNRSLSLKDFLFRISINPAVSKIIGENKDVVEEGDYVLYTENNVMNESTIVKDSVLEVLIGHKRGDKVLIDHFGNFQTIVIYEIHNRYFGLIREHCDDIAKNKSSKELQMVTLEELKSFNGNLLDGLLAFVGARADKEARAKFEKKYSEGKALLLLSYSYDNAFANCINRMFGEDIVYVKPYPPIRLPENLNYVLDLSSLLLLTSLSNIFGLEFEKKFVVPEGLHHYIDIICANEKVAPLPSIYQDAYMAFTGQENTNTKQKSLPSMVRKWMNNNCEFVVVAEVLDFKDKIQQEMNTFAQVIFESYMLANRMGNVLITEDWGWNFLQQNMPILNTHILLRQINYAKINEIEVKLADWHFAGVDIDANYMFNEYKKTINKENNSFDSCLEGLRVNPMLWQEGVKLSQLILHQPLSIPQESLVATKVLSKVLEGMPTELSNTVRGFIYLQNDTRLSQCFDNALRNTRTILLN